AIDDIEDKCERTDDISVIMNNFEKTYLETYREKSIDRQLLKEICDGIEIPLVDNHIQELEMKVTEKEIMDIIEFLPPGVSPGKDSVTYEMYSLKPEITSRCLAKVANVIAEMGVCPEDYLTNEVALLPKVIEPFHTSMYRLITLTNS